MANKIQQRRGLKANMPTLSAGEIGYATDTRETFIGTGSGNVNMGGSHWYRGTAMSGTSTTTGYYSFSACPQVKVDDMYLNTSNGNVYACTTAGSGSTAKWTYQGSIKGATGATGATGAVGADGQDLQAVYSSTPTRVGTWIDGSVIYRVAWTFTKAQNSGGSYIPMHEDLPKAPSIISDMITIKAIIKESYSLQEENNADIAHTYTNIEDLKTGITSYGSSDYTVYCIIEYILK